MWLPANPPAPLGALNQRELRLGGNRVRYTEAGSGPSVLLLHGAVFSGNNFWWSTQAALADRFRTIAPDFPGWGASDKPFDRYEVELYHRFLADFIARLGLERPIVVGHSMGGLIGSSFAVTHPQLVSGLATVAVPPAWVNVRIPHQFDRFMVPVIGEALLAAAPWLGPDFPFGMRQFYESLFHEPARHREPLREALVGCCRTLSDIRHQRAFLDTFRRNQLRLGDHVAMHAAAQRTDFPVLIVTGREDPLFPLPLVSEGARLLPRAEMTVLDACGHFPMWEQPEGFRSALVPWLDSVTKARENPLD